MPGVTESIILDLKLQNVAFLAAMNRTNSSLGQLARTIGLVTAAGAAMLAVRQGARLFDGAVGSAIQYEQELSKLRKTTGLTGFAIDEVRGSLAKLATTLGGVDYGELLKIGEIGGRMGLAAKDIGDFARDIEMATIAMDDVPAEELATKLARAANVFKLPTKAIFDMSAAINLLDDTSTATAREITDVFTRLSGPAAALGMAPQKVLALASVMKDAGVASEVAGTALTQVLSRLATSPEKFAEVAGVEFGRFARMMRADPLQALMAFENGLKKLDGASQFQVLDDIGLHGARVKTSLLQLAQVTGKLPGYVRSASEEWRTHARLLREVDVASNTTAAQLTRMNQNFLQLSIEVGNIALPVVRAFADGLSRLSSGLKNIVAANKGLTSGFVQPIADAVRYSGLLVTNFDDFVKLGKEWRLEKWEQLSTILGRVQDQLGPNLKAAGTNAMVDLVQAIAKGSLLLAPIFVASGQFFLDIWDRAGKQMIAKLVNPTKIAILSIEQAWAVFNAKKEDREKVLFAFTKRRHALEMEMGMQGQGGFAGIVAPGLRQFHAAQAGIQAQTEAGRVALPGFGEQLPPGVAGPPAPWHVHLFRGLPDHAEKIADAKAKLDEKLAEADEREKNARLALMPKPDVNRFVGKSMAALDQEERRIQGQLNRAQRDQAQARRELGQRGNEALRAVAGPNFVGPLQPGNAAAENRQATEQAQKYLGLLKQIRAERRALAQVPRAQRRFRGAPAGAPQNAAEQMAANRVQARQVLPGTAFAEPNPQAVARQNQRIAAQKQADAARNQAMQRRLRPPPVAAEPQRQRLQQEGKVPGPQANVLPALGAAAQAIAATQTGLGGRLAVLEQGFKMLAARMKGQAGLTAQAVVRADPSYPGNLPYGLNA